MCFFRKKWVFLVFFQKYAVIRCLSFGYVKFFSYICETIVKMIIVMSVKNVSKPMDVENTYTNLYITNLALNKL